LLAIALLQAAGCSGRLAGVGTTPRSTSQAPVTAGNPLLPTDKGPAASGIISENGGGAVGAGKASEVARPPGAQNGGAIVSNNGGGLIDPQHASSQGKFQLPAEEYGFGLAAGAALAGRLSLPEAWLATGKDVEVWPSNVQGIGLVDRADKPLLAKAGADGSFRFKDLKATRLAVLTLGLAGSPRVLIPAGEGPLEIDAAAVLVGTHLARFLGAYGQPDRQLAALDPAALQAATRAMADVLAAEPLPALKDVDGAIAGWRAKHPALNERLAALEGQVRQQVLAGLGVGRRALDVALPSLEGLALGPDGTLYLASRDEGVVLSLGADGLLAHVAGDGTSGAEPTEGRQARSAPLALEGPLGFDGAGLLLLLESDNENARWVVTRREADGRLVTVASWSAEVETGPGEGTPVAIGAGPDGGLQVLVEVYASEPEEGTASQRRLLAEVEEAGVFEGEEEPGLEDQEGDMGATIEDFAVPRRFVTWRWPAGGGAPRRGEVVDADFQPLPDGRGGLVALGDALLLVAPSGESSTLATGLGKAQNSDPPVAVAPDGTLYAVIGNEVWRVADGRATRVAGKP
jgi:hypothetical protein